MCVCMYVRERRERKWWENSVMEQGLALSNEGQLGQIPLIAGFLFVRASELLGLLLVSLYILLFYFNLSLG